MNQKNLNEYLAPCVEVVEVDERELLCLSADDTQRYNTGDTDEWFN